MKQARQLLILVLACLGSFALTAQNLATVEVTITLGDDCTATLLPSQVLTGDLGETDFDDYTVNVQDGLTGNGAIIDGCGRFIYTVVGPDGVDRWNYVNAEDKTGPVVVTTPNDTTLLCNQLETYSLTMLPSSVSRCYRISDTDGDGVYTTVAGTMATELRRRLSLSDATNPLDPAIVATFADGCADQIEVCVQDRLEQLDMCEPAVITRTFTAREIPNCQSVKTNPTASTSFQIFFAVPSIDDVISDVLPAVFECDDPEVLADDFSPRTEDFPFIVFNEEIIYLSEGTLCNLAVTFEDGPRIPTDCGFKFIRTFTVLDWCVPGAFETFPQVVKVSDTTAPELTVVPADTIFANTNAGNRCGAFLRLDRGVSVEDNCNDATVFADIFPGGDLDGTPIGTFELDLGGPITANLSSFIPAGTHAIVYTAVDECGNTATETRVLVIRDATPPVAICEDGLNISLSTAQGNGIAVITPQAIDAGSYDDCSGVSLLIACDINGDGDFNDRSIGEAYVEQVVVDCDDLGQKDVSLLVTDAQGNSNTCWLTVLIEDKTAPVCFDLDDVTLTCIEYQNLPFDLLTSTIEERNARFQPFAGLDDCNTEVVFDRVSGDINSCGIGEFTREFRLRQPGSTLQSPLCTQTITIIAVNDYTVVFPTDEEGPCEMIPEYDDLDVTEVGCDLITVNTKVDTFRSLEAAEECFKLEVTYDVINWCEYNTLGEPYRIPRDGDLAEAGGVDRNPETELLYLHVRPRNLTTRADDFAFLSRDADRAYTATNASALRIDAILDDGDDTDGSDDNNDDDNDDNAYGVDDSRGFFRYVQFIKVYDDVAPVITYEPTEDCFGGAGVNCVADVQLTFTATDECTDLGLNNLLVQLIPNYTPGSAAGAVVVTGNVGSVVNNGNGTFTVQLNDVPVGNHAIRVQARDGCGNFDVEVMPFCVSPDKAPTPICIQTLTVTLMPVNGNEGMAAIWATDFIASPSYDCFGNLINKYAIYRDDANTVTPSPIDTGLVLTCADYSEDTPDVLVRVYAIDNAGNADYCQVNIDVQKFNDDVCEDTGNTGSLAGAIATQDDEFMGGVEVSLTGANSMDDMFVTNADGAYSFASLPLGVDYTVQPSYTAGVDLGAVKTSDIVAVMNHVLGTTTLNNVYDQIAADVNRDEQIDIFDMVGMRRVILGLDNGFPGNVTYRFVPVDFQFAGNNYAAAFPEVYNVNNLPGNVRTADFIAIELGDVRRDDAGRASSSLDLEDAQLAAGEVHTINLSTEAAGFQGTLELAAGLELVNITYGDMEAGNLNLNRVAEGLIGMSYNGNGAELISLEVRATESARLSDMVSLTNRLVYTEGVAVNGASTDLSLNFASSNVAALNGLAQNTPNPVVENTRIDFTLAEAAAVSLTIQDIQGRTVMVRELDGVAGLNTVNVSVNELGAATGVLSYTVTAGNFTATKKMVVVR